jgi:Tol biopolymer transport system component
LVYSTNRNGSWDIYALSLETGEEYQITDHPQNEVISDWGSNDFILFSANWGSTDPPSTELPIVTPFDEIYMIGSCLEE